MKTNQPLVSIIMPTLNSAYSIKLSLESIKKQDYPKNKIEILVIDGGSTDSTISIARKFPATILKNLQVQPEHAKSIGLQKARGKYAMFLDSDEVLLNSHSISDKVNLLTNNLNCRNVVTSGLKCPPGFPFLSQYINRIGDPFSYFIYRIDGGNFFESLRKRYSVLKSTKDYELIGFRPRDLTPIVDGGGHFFDLDHLKSIDDVSRNSLSAQVFTAMAGKTHCLGVLKKDFVRHYSKPSLSGYIRKIKWRIVSNLYAGDKNIPGYQNRERYLRRTLKLKKYLFIPYSLSLILPLLDSLFLATVYSDIRYLIHAPLTYYTAIEIIIQLAKRKLLGGSLSAGVYK